MKLTPEERHRIYLCEEAWGDPTDEEAQQVQAGIGGGLTIEEFTMLDPVGRIETVMTAPDQNSRDFTRISEIIPKVMDKAGQPTVVAWLEDYGAKESADLVPAQYGHFLNDCEMLLRQGKSHIAAAQFLADTAPSPEYRDIADLVIAQVERLEQAGMKFVLCVVHRGDWIPSGLEGSRGLVWRGWQSTLTRVYIQGADVRGYVGTSYQNVLHELIHAVTQAAIYVDIHKSSDGTEGALADELNALRGVAESYLRGRIDSGAMLTPFEQGFSPRQSPRQNYFCRDSYEFLEWGLIWHETQHYLEVIPYKGETLWSAFVAAIRRFLKLSEKASAALSKLLRNAVSRRRFSVRPITALPHMTINDPGGSIVCID